MALGEHEARPLRGCESTLFFYPRIEKESPEKPLWHVTEAWSEGILWDKV